MAEDDEPHLFALDAVEEPAGTGKKIRFVVVLGPGFAVHGEQTLHHDGITREQDTPGLRQAQQNGLVVRSIVAGFEEGETGKKFRVAMDETVAQSGMVPLRARVSKARMAAVGEFVVLALDDEFRI